MKDGKYRLPIGAALLALIAGIVWLDRRLDRPWIAPILAMGLGSIAFFEYLRLCGARALGPLRAAAVVAAGAIVVATVFPGRADALGLAVRVLALFAASYFVIALGLIAARWRSAVQPPDFGLAATVYAGLAMTVLPMALLAATFHLRPEGVLLGMLVVVGSKLNDIAGYLVGSTMGRHKLCPGISPGKTWEGAIGGLVAGTLGTLAIVTLTPLKPLITPAEALLLGVTLSIATQAGDLFESVFKRSMGVKDSAALIPAFGGILDLVDSLIFAAPLGYTMAVLYLDG